MHSRKRLLSLGAAVAALGVAGGGYEAQADTVDYTITASTTAYGGYEVSYLNDGDFLTDYASQGGGVGTFVDLDFGAPVMLASVLYADRTSSGGGNRSNTGGELDDVLGFNLIFSLDDTFGNSDDQLLGFVNNNGPGGQAYPAGDVTHVLLGGIVAQYVRFQVNDTSGASPNVGGAELQFTAVPVPPAVLGGAGLLALSGGAHLWRRRRTI